MYLKYGNKAIIMKLFLQILLILFALMLCTIKNNFLANTGIQNAKTLNAVKLTNSASLSCYAIASEVIHKNETKITKTVLTNAFPEQILSFGAHKIIFQSAIFTFFSNAPPFYILYQRLKVCHIV